MDTVKAIDLRMRCDFHFCEQYNVSLFRTRGPKQRPPCWELHDDMAMLDTALRGFACGPIYIIQDNECKIDDVFDGAHRCEAIFKFLENKYPITKSKKDTINWDSSPLRNYVGKYFRELPGDIQRQIKDYKFYINVIDADTASDPASLGLLWERLSKAGKPLNKFETKSQTHTILHRDVLTPSTEEWFGTVFFPAKISKRGQLELKLNKLLALSEKEVLPPYNSMDSLVEKWSEETLGNTVEKIDKTTEELKESFLARLRVLRNLLKELQDRNVLHTERGESVVEKGKDLVFLLLLGRLGFWFPTVSHFRRVADDVCPLFKELLVMDSNDLCKYLGQTSRNANFQRKLIENIDGKFKPLAQAGKERRLFTQEEKKRKMEEQGGLCTECKLPLLDHQRTAGDHIVEYWRGGKTEVANCQVIHKLCHEKITKG